MDKYKILSGSALKVIAVLSMLIDHAAGYLLRYFKWAWTPLFSVLGKQITPMYIMNGVLGRIAFPLFCFLAVEGYVHTSNIRKYAGNLLLFAVISIVPWNLAHGFGPLECHSFNVLFTLLFGVVSIYAIDKLKGWRSFAVVIGCLCLAYVMKTDYSFIGVITIIVMYAVRSHRGLQSLSMVGCLFHGKSNVGIILAALPILMYNGKRGFVRGKASKYVFYAIYPLQFLLFAVLAHIIR